LYYRQSILAILRFVIDFHHGLLWQGLDLVCCAGSLGKLTGAKNFGVTNSKVERGENPLIHCPFVLGEVPEQTHVAVLR